MKSKMRIYGVQCNLKVTFLHSLFLFPVCIWKSKNYWGVFVFYYSKLTQFTNMLPDHFYQAVG